MTIINFSIGFLEVSWADILDILLVGLLIYKIYKWSKGSVASKILIGILAIYGIYLGVDALGMELLSSIFGQFINVGGIAALILFQQEIRKFLLFVGKIEFFRRNQFFRTVFKGTFLQASPIDIQAIVEAMHEMATHHHNGKFEPMGALMVIARSSDLSHYVESGDMLDANINKRLLLSIFNKLSPLHDGAVIIDKNGRLVAARCILPVSENPEIPAQMGLRHRAAIGVAEVTDALVLVVSEERGSMSLVKNGQIQTNLTAEQLYQKLNFALNEEQRDQTDPTATASTVAPEDKVTAPATSPKE
ncbi:diadenylate cyclase CdaA [Eisenibacter elegans]|uniref:diadenylate cyclase CdaA n=1 Tax=Eisenibacter elegans TaxID=997 RepID=UPI000402E8F0|nr:diadenylate cyclase CdaA [Eisenibacter elegans]